MCKAWIATFGGSGHLKYLDELLELFCNFVYELPQRTTTFIWNNSIASLTGNEGSYVPLDLIQEWMIGEIKSHLARSDEAFDASFARDVVAPNVRGALECKKAMKSMFGLVATARHRGDGLDDECVARLLRDIRSTEANRFRRGRHYGHVAHDDDTAGYNTLEKGKLQSFLMRTTADVCASGEASSGPDAGTSADEGLAAFPEPDVSALVEGLLNPALVDGDLDIWDGWDEEGDSATT